MAKTSMSSPDDGEVGDGAGLPRDRPGPASRVRVTYDLSRGHRRGGLEHVLELGAGERPQDGHDACGQRR